MLRSSLVFQIRNPEGLYSAGGNPPRWTKAGKVWSTLGYLKNHLHGVKTYDKELTKYKNCELIAYEVIKSDPTITSLKDIIECLK